MIEVMVSLSSPLMLPPQLFNVVRTATLGHVQRVAQMYALVRT